MINFPDYEYLHDVDIVSSDFIQRITSVINKIALFKEMRIKNYSHNWFDDENLDKIILRDKHLKKFKASRRNIDEQFVLFFFLFFFNWGFLSRPFTNHRTAGEGGGHFFNSLLPLPPASRALRH